jgi:hypothetical protein
LTFIAFYMKIWKNEHSTFMLKSLRFIYTITKFGCNSLVPRSLDQWIHYFFTGLGSLEPVNSLKIQWNHLRYRDTFCYTHTHTHNTKLHKKVVIKTNFIIMFFKICKCLQICLPWKNSLGRMNPLLIEPLPNLHCMMNYDTYIQQVNSMKRRQLVWKCILIIY